MEVSTLRTLTLAEVTAAVVTNPMTANHRPRTGLVIDSQGVAPLAVIFGTTEHNGVETIHMSDYGKRSALNHMAPAENQAVAVQPLHTTYREETPYRMSEARSLRDKWINDGFSFIGAYRTYTQADNAERFQINLFCLPLLRLPGFYENLMEYQNYPDEGLRISDGYHLPVQDVRRIATENDVQRVLDHNDRHPQQHQAVPVAGEEWLFRERPFARDLDIQWEEAVAAAADDNAQMKTSNEWEYIAFASIYSFTKAASGDTEQQKIQRYKENLVKRLSALKATKADRSMVVDHFINTHLNVSHLIRHFEDMAFYPRLKCMILRTLVTSQDPVCANLKTLLSDHQMSVFCGIAAFTTTRNLTALHVCPEVAEHYGRFVQVMAGLKAKFGSEGWRYVKLLDPLNQITSGQSFKELGTAARAWVAVQPGQESFAHLVNKGGIPTKYKAWARKPLPADLVEQGNNLLEATRVHLAHLKVELRMENFTAEAWRELVAITPEQMAQARAGNDVW
nr:MAG: hypothetical protein [XiangYun mono-chu-like virus 8]